MCNRACQHSTETNQANCMMRGRLIHFTLYSPFALSALNNLCASAHFGRSARSKSLSLPATAPRIKLAQSKEANLCIMEKKKRSSSTVFLFLVLCCVFTHQLQQNSGALLAIFQRLMARWLSGAFPAALCVCGSE